MTTSPEQRESFRAHILTAVTNSLKPAELVMAFTSFRRRYRRVRRRSRSNIEDEEKFIPVRDGDQEPDPEEVEDPDTV